MGLTFDTGALIALERREIRMRKILDTALAGRVVITVPAAVVAGWWRARSPRHDAILAMFTVEDLGERLAKLAGEAMAAVPSATVVDAIVMASAASRGDPVYTSDIGDLVKLRDGRFPGVRVLAV
jgi:predicted nucleic acid-binding protein